VQNKKEVTAIVRGIMRRLGTVRPNFVQMLQNLIKLLLNVKNIRLDVPVMVMDVYPRALV